MPGIPFSCIQYGDQYCHHLGIHVIAEGVETEAQLERPLSEQYNSILT